MTTNTLVYPNASGITATPLTGTSLALPSGYLVGGHSYRWAMTSFTSSTESAQSAYLYFQTPAAVAAPPTINAPGDTISPGPALSSLTPTFAWSVAAGASGYGLYIRDVTTNTLVYPNSSGITGTPLAGTSFSLPSGYLVNGHAYRWAMTSFTNSTESVQSSYRYFQTPGASAIAPGIVSPGATTSPGTTIGSLAPTFTWNPAANATGYGLYIRDMTTNTLVYPNAGGITATPLTGTSLVLPVGYLASGHAYRWAMTSFTNATESAQSSYLYFQAPGAVAVSPAIASPGSVSPPGTATNDLTPTFTWSTAANATGYGLYIRDLTTNTLVYPNASGTTATPLIGNSISLPAGYLVSGHAYRWAMTSFTNSTESAQSAYLYFQTPGGGGASVYLSFPLAGYTPYDAPITSVFDHSMTTRFAMDNRVVVFTGEIGDQIDFVESPTPPYSFKKSGQSAFGGGVINYVGTALSGPTTVNYDGHPGYDYRVPTGTDVFAAADGRVVVADASNSTDAGNYVRLEDAATGYQTQYLHLRDVLVPVGADVLRGQLIGRSGNTGGPGGPVGAHLHFEVKKLVGGNWISVDPYGWRGSGADPYVAATNVNLWSGAVGTQVLGVDASTYNGFVDWPQVRGAGAKAFAIVRATAGMNTTDQTFAANVVAARNAGLLVGAYHFAYPEYFTPHEEAQKFLSVAQPYIGTGYLPPVLDIEDSASEDSFPLRMGHAALSQWIRDWCSEVEQATGVAGRKVVLYTFRWYLQNGYFEADLNRHPLWIATYPSEPGANPGNIAPWSTWTFQQYRTDPVTQDTTADQGGTAPGFTGYADLDSFNGDRAALDSLANGFGPNPTVTEADLNGDGKSDLLYRNGSTGQVFRLLMNGFTVTNGTAAYAEPNTAWNIVAEGDFNGDSIADLLWRNASTGQVFVQPFSSSGLPSGGAVVMSEPNAAWKIVATPDLNGDGKADILWWNSTTGQVWAMLMNGAAISAQGPVYTEPNTQWKIVAVGDFAGAGKRNQILWRNSASGQVYLQTVTYSGGVFAQSGAIIYTEPNLAWKILAAADFNGDGKSDILWRNDVTGQVYMMLMSGTSITSQAIVYTEPNLNWKVVSVGDYNGDNKADILYRNYSTGQVYELQMSGLSVTGASIVYTEPNLSWLLLGPLEYFP